MATLTSRFEITKPDFQERGYDVPVNADFDRYDLLFWQLTQTVRLIFVNTTTIRLDRFQGDQIHVNGKIEGISAAGETLTTADNLISATGTDSGSPPGATQTLSVYRSNLDASFAPSDLRASLTAPSLFLGRNYLGITGNALNWLYVGTIDTDGAILFDSSTLVSEYNADQSSGGGLTKVEDDLNPKLGGDLDLGGFDLVDSNYCRIAVMANRHQRSGRSNRCRDSYAP